MNRMNKDEFKNAMRAAKVEEEINEILKDIDDPIKEDLIEDPEDLSVENPEETGKSVEKTTKTASNRQKSTSNGTKTSETASVAAEQKPRKKSGPKPGTKKLPCKKLQEAAGQKTDEEDITKKQEEALKAMCSLTVGYTQQLIKGVENNLKTAEKLTDMAIIYNGYVETVEEMLK